jgi:ligand-binding sensor protein
MEMTDLHPKAYWAALEQEICDRFRLNGRVYDANGFTFTGHVTWCNRLCPEIKARPEGVSGICSVAHQVIAGEAAASGACVIAECDAGIRKICCPVLVDGTLVGVVGGCGRLAPDADVEAYLIEKTAGIPEAEAEQLARSVEPMSDAEAQEAAAFMRGRIQEALNTAARSPA